jgi:signal transduction histidine kinase
VDLLERREQMLLLLSVEDVTRLHEARATALRRARELAREHRRKDEFLAMLGHELRNPLAALVNGLSLLEHVGSDPEQMQKIHPILVRQTRRMTVMLDQLLDISQISSGEFAVELRPVSLVPGPARRSSSPVISSTRRPAISARPRWPRRSASWPRSTKLGSKS